MSHSLSNLTLSLPTLSSSQRTSSTHSKLYCPKFPKLLSQIGNRGGKISVRAVGGDGRENLDHLQIQRKNQQPPPKKRVAQAAPLGLWDRFPTARTVNQMMDTMERMMEDPFAFSYPPPPSSAETGGYSRGRTPWEIKEGEGEYKMRFDMPGMAKDDVRVWVEEKMLVAKAEKQKRDGEEEEEAEGEWSAKSYGRYSCRIALPENVEFEKIKAEVRDGVLYVIVPKASERSKVFDISVE